MREDRAADLIRSRLAARGLSASELGPHADDLPLASWPVDSVVLISVAADLQQLTGVHVDDEVLFDPALTISRLTASICDSAAVVVGVGAVASTGSGSSRFWNGLVSGDAFRVPAPFAGLERYLVGARPGSTPADLVAPDRLLTLARSAAEQAVQEHPDRSSIDLVFATTDVGGNALGAALDARRPSVDAVPGHVAEQLSVELGLGGEVLTIGSASASGSVALGHALDVIRSGPPGREVLVVGADTVSETATAGLAALRTLSVDGCRPFSSARRGMAISEGAGAVLLRAVRVDDVAGRARLLGYGASSRTAHPTAPETSGIESALRRSLDDAGIRPESVAFVNAHGPGTKTGDQAEVAALAAVFGSDLSDLPLTSSKGVLWHTQGAAGILESLACLASLEHWAVTPTHGAEPLDQEWDELLISSILQPPRPGAHAVSISCGLGGVNTATVWTGADSGAAW